MTPGASISSHCGNALAGSRCALPRQAARSEFGRRLAGVRLEGPVERSDGLETGVERNRHTGPRAWSASASAAIASVSR